MHPKQTLQHKSEITHNNSQNLKIMKKYLYLSIVALMGAAMMVGCKPKNTPSGTDPVDPSTLDNKTVKCWEYTLTESGKSATLYFWGTERSLVTFIERSEESKG